MLLREQMASVLQLQQKRCQVYMLWGAKFRRVLEGSLSATDFDDIIRTVVVKELQYVSHGLRTVHAEVQQRLTPGTSDAGAMSAEELGGARVLLKWIDELQDVERNHYNVTIEYLKTIVAHTAPNVVGKPLVEAGTEVAEEDSKAAATTSTTATAESLEAVDIAPSYSVHDGGDCYLRRAFPDEALVNVRFVDCSDALDTLAAEGEDGEGSGQDEGHTQTGGDMQPLHTSAADRDPTASPGVTGTSRVGGYYSAAAVARACKHWSEAVARLHATKQELEQAATALVEDLQCELSDLTSSNP